jgi:hypothetical protein
VDKIQPLKKRKVNVSFLVVLLREEALTCSMLVLLIMGREMGQPQGYLVRRKRTPNSVHEFCPCVWLTQTHTCIGETLGRPDMTERNKPKHELLHSTWKMSFCFELSH